VLAAQRIMANMATSATKSGKGGGGGKSAGAATDPFLPRQRKVREAMLGHELTHLLVSSPLDVGYLTGFTGGDSYLLIGPRQPGAPVTAALISDFRYQEELQPFADKLEIIIRKRSMGEAVADLLSGPGVERVGIQADIMTVAERDALAKKIGTKKVASTVGLINKLRSVKDAHEIDLIRRAVKIQEAALLEVLPTIEAGQTEQEIAARLESEMKARGSAVPSFDTIVGAKGNSALPHYRAGEMKVANNNVLLIDWGATYKGYHSDMTRTFALGKWPKKMAEIYEIVLEAHKLSAAALCAGKSSAEIDRVARDHIAAAGYGENFGHSLGHGIGLQIHEEPRLSHMLAGVKLQAGQVVTIEPGIYLPGVGGVRLENDYVVTETGSECLATLPMTLEWATLG
jgi:Xaa-Pro aminopeptidase